MIATTTSNNESMTGKLSAETGYRGSDLIDFSEDYDCGEASFLARGDYWVEEEKSHWGCGGGDINMGFFDEHGG
jgi:hypothetical protein